MKARGSGRGSQQYRNVFTLGAAGLLFLGAGIAGWDVRRARWQEARWVDPPIWWEIGVGLACLALAVLIARPLLKRSA